MYQLTKEKQSWKVPSGDPLKFLEKPHIATKVISRKFWKKSSMSKSLTFKFVWKKPFPLIAVTAATAPLLGLLGTVTGMIDVFRQITNFANPENSELARGISEALVTTKFGLITAIPSLIVHALLSRRLQGVISKLEAFAARLVHLKRNEPLLKESDLQQDEPPS